MRSLVLEYVKTSWKLGLFSYKFLFKHSILLILPLLSASCFCGSLLLLYKTSQLANLAHTMLNLALLTIVAYYVAIFLSVFFNVMAISLIHSYLRNNKNFSLLDAFKIAMSRLSPIAMWAFVSGFIGLLIGILDYIGKRGGISRRILSAILDVTWSVSTYFVVPLICFDPSINPITLVNKSVSTLKKLCGKPKSLARVIGTGMVTLFLGIPIYVLVTIIAGKIHEPDIANILYMMSGIMTIMLLYFGSIAHNVLLTIFYINTSERPFLQDVTIDKDLLNKALVRHKSFLD